MYFKTLITPSCTYIHNWWGIAGLTLPSPQVVFSMAKMAWYRPGSPGTAQYNRRHMLLNDSVDCRLCGNVAIYKRFVLYFSLSLSLHLYLSRPFCCYLFFFLTSSLEPSITTSIVLIEHLYQVERPSLPNCARNNLYSLCQSTNACLERADTEGQLRRPDPHPTRSPALIPVQDLAVRTSPCNM